MLVWIEVVPDLHEHHFPILIAIHHEINPVIDCIMTFCHLSFRIDFQFDEGHESGRTPCGHFVRSMLLRNERFTVICYDARMECLIFESDVR